MKSVFSIFSTLLVAMCLFSCSAEDEVFSCDPDVNEWVQANLTDIRKMTRVEWEEINNPEYQQAAFGAFYPEQKRDFWIIKLNQVLKLDWNVQEQMHIQNLLQYVKEDKDLFENKELKDDFYLYVHTWIEYAQEELGWEQSVVWSIMMNGYRVMNTRGDVAFPTSVNNPMLKSSYEPKCDCHVGNVMWTTCSSLANKSCQRKPCESSVHFCGAMMVESCNGLCTY